MIKNNHAVMIHSQFLAAMAARLEKRWPVLRWWNEEDVMQAPQARVLLTSGVAIVDGALMDRMPHLELIAGLAAGYEGIDIYAAQERGIAVTNGAIADNGDVADWVLGALIYLLRDFAAGDRIVRDGVWKADWPQLGKSLRGRTVGILGLGGIGTAVAERCDALRMRVLWWGPRKKTSPYECASSLEALADAADALVITCPLSDETSGLVDQSILDRLGSNGYLINVARGGIVDEDALVRTLGAGGLAGAALDVFETEPTDPAKWCNLDNVLLSPHQAGSTQERIAEMIELCIENIARQMEGRSLLSKVI